MRPLHTGLIATAVTILTLLASAGPVWAADANPNAFRSYKEWKNEKIQQAQGRLEIVKVKMSHRGDPNLAKSSSGTEGHDPESRILESQFHTEEISVETAKELTVSDYFAGYLIKVSNKHAAFKEAAGKFTADEVAELMAAYADSVFGVDTTSNLPSSAHAGTDGIK